MDSVKEHTHERRVPATLARSWMLVSARDRDRFDEVATSRGDQLIIDIEDGVDPTHKAKAREDVLAWFAQGGSAWVRFNDRRSDYWADDIAAFRSVKQGLLGVMLAKTESPTDVTDTVESFESELQVIPLIESALGIERATEIAQAPGVFRLAFGSGDYRRDTGTSATDLAMAYPRSRLVVASTIGGLPGPIDGPTVSPSLPVLREQSEVAVQLGMTGKLCLDLRQVPVINECISPTTADVIWARDFLDDFHARGGVIRDGSDLPRLGRAKKIDAFAHAFGIDPER